MPNPTTNATQNQQTHALRELLRIVVSGNAFYQPILRQAGLNEIDALTVEDFIDRMPLTTKQQLVDDQQAYPPYGSNLSQPIEHYTRFCQTSGTTGKPLRVIDTADSWQSLLDVWRLVFEQAGCKPGDRVLFAFSFGPFLGFWTAYEAGAQMGLMCLPAGGMSSTSRIAMLFENQVDTVCCTPTYALHLAEVALAAGQPLADSTVQRLIVAGEPGGSIPAVRSRIEDDWGATVYDHHGMTETGPVTYQDNDVQGSLRIADNTFLVEVIDPVTTTPVTPGTEGELVLTTLKRTAWPLLRYRTGDIVKQDPKDPLRLVGGILGRIDDMRLVRGVNVYPSAIDAIVRRFDEVVEYEVLVEQTGTLCELSITVEQCDDPRTAPQVLRSQIAEALRDALSLRIPVQIAQTDSLPRYEMKAKRWREVTS